MSKRSASIWHTRPVTEKYEGFRKRSFAITGRSNSPTPSARRCAFRLRAAIWSIKEELRQTRFHGRRSICLNVARSSANMSFGGTR